jgi:hypothetical protein
MALVRERVAWRFSKVRPVVRKFDFSPEPELE